MHALDRRAQLLAEIAARLRPVCLAMPAAQFDAMVEDIADVTLKFEKYSTPTLLELEMLRRHEAVERGIGETVRRT